MFEVEYGQPIPPIRRKLKPGTRRRSKWPFNTTEPGGYFFVPVAESKSTSSYVARQIKQVGGEWVTRRCWARPARPDEIGRTWVIEDAQQDPDTRDPEAVEGYGIWRTK